MKSAPKNKAKRANTKKQTKVNPFLRFTQAVSLRGLLFALVFGGIAAAVVLLANASPDLAEHPVRPFVEDRARGLVWKDLTKDERICPGGYLIAQSRGADPQANCTHGPDPAPPGMDATRSVEPLSTGAEGTVVASGIPCDGDGVTGKRVEMIYARASDKVDRYGQFASSFQTYAANMNNIFIESGNENGSPRSIRFVTDANCNVVVRNEVLSTTADDSFGNTRSELTQRGYNRSDRKYIVWMDATVYCGIANIYGDTQPGSANRSNTGPTFGRVDSGCWGGRTEVHELVHTIGGVQLNSPHTSGGYHCNDDRDRMCYADGGSTSAMFTACADTIMESRLDCNDDDYFNSSPNIPSTNYLATNWNVANSLFLIAGGTVTTPPPPTPTTDTTAPVARITQPTQSVVSGNKAMVAANATDNVSVTKIELYIDNIRVTTVAGSTLSYNWNLRKASRGQHTLTVKAYDAAGNVGTATMFVTK